MPPKLSGGLLLLVTLSAQSDENAALAVVIERFNLDNGLRVILRPIQGAKQTALVVLFDIGENHDPVGKSGLGHLIEHLYVTAGAGSIAPRSADQWFRDYPDGCNAQTGPDYTVMATVFQGDSLEKEIEEAASRMGQLQIVQSDLDREQPRLLTEIGNMFGGMPALAAANLAKEQIRPKIEGSRKGGTPEAVAGMTLTEIQERYQNLYKPVNAVVIVAGDIDPQSCRQSITAHFKDIPPGTRIAASALPVAGVPNADPQIIPVNSVLPGAGSTAAIAYPAPAPGSPHYVSMLVLASRMWMRMGASGGTLQVMFAPLDDPSAISLSASLEPGESPQAAVGGLMSIVDEIANQPLQTGEVMMTKNNFGMLFGAKIFPDAVLAQNPYGVAFSLGRTEQMKVSWSQLSADIDALTPEQLAESAKSIFGADHRAAVVAEVSKP